MIEGITLNTYELSLTLILICCIGRCALTTGSSAGQMNNMKPKSTTNPRWRRVVFKISSAALAGAAPNNIDSKVY